MLAAALGYINYRAIGIPHATDLTIMGAAASVIIVALDRLVPDAELGHMLW